MEIDIYTQTNDTQVKLKKSKWDQQIVSVSTSWLWYYAIVLWDVAFGINSNNYMGPLCIISYNWMWMYILKFH